jgi:hypothetical protein
MGGREIPQLVFATRGPDPKSGSDFVRQVVAERAGVSEEARRELSRRADIAGSVLQFHQRDAGHPRGAETLRVFFFHPLADGTWLFARAVSLGLYRKGSHQLLVHGVVLDEEALDGLEANPLALDTPEDVGFRFLDRHPGAQELAPLALRRSAFEHARRHNRRRLAETPAAEDAWIAAAYDALASGERVACVSAEPRPEALERLLLHFHPDDRLEIGFNTFYAHRRQVDYRLIALLPEDLAEARSQFRGLRTVDLAAPPSAARDGLGELACKLRRSSPADFHYAVSQALVTHLSNRRRQPRPAADAALVLRASLDRKPLSAADSERLEVLFQRAGGGLAYLVAHLAARWVKDPEELRQALDAAARADEKITREQVERYREERLDAGTAAQSWALAALLTRREAFADDALSSRDALDLWRRLLTPPRLAEPAPGQAALADEILGHWALADAGLGDPAADPPDWATVLRWLGERRRPAAALAAEVEAVLAGRRKTDTPPAWRRFGDLLRELGADGEARRVLLVREIPRLSAFEARLRLEPEVDRILDAGGGGLPDLAPHLGRPGVAAAVFGRAAERAASRPGEMPWSELRRCLQNAEGLDSGAAEDAGRLLAAIFWSASAGEDLGGWLVDRCRRLSPAGALAEAFTVAVLKIAAAILQPVCEAADRATDLRPILAAAAGLLDVRGRHPTTSGADVELIRLAVRGRVLAAAAGEAGESAAAARLDVAWKPFLGYLSRGQALDDPDPADALEWLDLLQDELFAEPPEAPAEDAALAVFFDLAWSLWGREPAARDALSFKLRWALRLADGERQSWFPVKLAERFRPRAARGLADRQRTRMRRRVPRRLWPQAETLLSPPVLRTTAPTTRGDSP